MDVDEHRGRRNGGVGSRSRRRGSENQLRETEAKFRTLIEQIPAIVYIDPLDPPSPVESLYVSPQVERMLGIPQESTTSDRDWWIRLIHPDDRQRVLAASDEADRTRGSYRIEYRIRTAEGRELWVHDEAELVRDEEGVPMFWQGLMLDITDQKRAEEELSQALLMERRALRRLQEANELKDAARAGANPQILASLDGLVASATALDEGEGRGISVRERRDLVAEILAESKRLRAALTPDPG